MSRNKKHRAERAVHIELTREFLMRRVTENYPLQRWIHFCTVMLNRGYKVTLYEALETVSKYVTVHGINDDYFRVRFSNHKPNAFREKRGDCDVFVGVNNFGCVKTEDAIAATFKHFGAVP